MTIRLAAALLACVLSASAASAVDTTAPVKVPTTDPAMLAAFKKATASVDAFLDTWRRPPPRSDGFAVKIGLGDVAGSTKDVALAIPGESDNVEWFWIVDLHDDGAGLSGRVSNDPETIHNVTRGQTIRFEKKNIADWMYFVNVKMVGNATACPALAHAGEEERAEFKKQYGVACD
jgi:uncharacterized protein YegJ (DUF2314 family)